MAQSRRLNWPCREKKGGAAFGITEIDSPSPTPGREDEKLLPALVDYLKSCQPVEGNSKRAHHPFPNLAGFCRHLGMSVEEFDALRLRSPDVWGKICTALEDEALNSDLSPTLLSTYLKQRLGYGEKPDKAAADCGQMTLVFEHDIAEDGL